MNAQNERRSDPENFGEANTSNQSITRFCIELQNQGLRVDFEETEGPKCKMLKIGISENYFPKGKPVDQVHEFVDRGRRRSTVGTVPPCVEPRRG
jgi:hypothetical protein